jgi:hypothetical protein
VPSEAASNERAKPATMCNPEAATGHRFRTTGRIGAPFRSFLTAPAGTLFDRAEPGCIAMCSTGLSIWKSFDRSFPARFGIAAVGAWQSVAVRHSQSPCRWEFNVASPGRHLRWCLR